jgi:hypothetical protein
MNGGVVCMVEDLVAVCDSLLLTLLRILLAWLSAKMLSQHIFSEEHCRL